MSRIRHATEDWVKKKYDIINTAQGSLIPLPDSAEAPIPSMRIFGKTKQATTTGKNKLNTRLWKTEFTRNDVTAKYLPDEDCFLFNGTATENVSFYSVDYVQPVDIGEAYTLLCEAVSGSATGDGSKIFYLGHTDDLSATQENWEVINISTTNSKTVLPSKKYIKKAWFYISGGVTFTNFKFKLMFSKGTDTTYEPYTGGMPSPNPSYPQALESVGDDGSVEQFVKGGNLLDISQYAKTSNANTVLDGDRLTITGYLTYVDVYGLEVGKKYTYSWKAEKSSEYGGGFALERFYTDGTRKLMVSSAEHLPERSPYTFTMAENVEFMRFYFYGGKQTINDNPTTATYYDVQLKEGETAKPYEPYKSQSLTIPTPNGLPGVPVSSGGNYTDENGQQYVSDYKDYERMVYVQRVGETTVTFKSTNSLSSGNRYGVCALTDKIAKSSVGAISEKASFVSGTSSTKPNTLYENTNNFVFVGSTDDTDETLRAKYEGSKLLYVLAEPIETPLSEEEIAAYKALHTNYPNTTIYNDEGAYTEVKYVADTKNYVDNKFAELQANILNAIG